MQVLARRRGYTLVEFLIVLGVVAVVGGLMGLMVWPGYISAREGSRRASCQSNLKLLGIGFLQYTQDNDNRLVPVATGSAHSYGWADAVQPYLYQPQLLQCPAEATLQMAEDAKRRSYTDYWMNANLSRVELKSITSPAQSILSGDGNDGTDNTNARYSLRSLPQAWRKNKQSPAYRHVEQMNILYADGHVKTLEHRRVVTGAPSNGAHATFAVKWRE